jgi:hypothetical protein
MVAVPVDDNAGDGVLLLHVSIVGLLRGAGDVASKCCCPSLSTQPGCPSNGPPPSMTARWWAGRRRLIASLDAPAVPVLEAVALAVCAVVIGLTGWPGAPPGPGRGAAHALPRSRPDRERRGDDR